ncbi:MAG: hypothetical protein HQL99_10190 [Magnetococcales bacterium]|nr:hypothetical protein [Magnetococcales bacterium]
MSTKLHRLLLMAGRDLKENPYRELIIKRLLEQRGVEVIFAVPGRGINKGASADAVRDDPVLTREGAIQIDGEWHFRQAMRGCQIVVFSTWRSYLPLTRLAQAEGRPTINFCATSGLDHWSHGVERCLIRSRFTHRMLRFEHETMGLPMPSDDQIRIVGSIQYEYPDDHRPTVFPDRERFCHHYGLDPARPIAVLFPKGIQSFHKKVTAWFPHWNPQQVDQYHQWFLDRYARICEQTRNAGCNLLIKMHPTAYVGYNCDTASESTFWQQFPWAKILEAQHTMAMFQHADVGLGINSHASLDMGYFNKPFIYVDSDLIPLPDLPIFNVNKLVHLTPGPSTHWHTQPMDINPWFRSWLGAFSRVEDLPGLLIDPARTLPIQPADREAFITEFWGVGDNQASVRIVNEIMQFGEESLASWSRRLSWPRWRGRVMDGIHRLRGRHS